MWVEFLIVEGLVPPQPAELIERFGENGEKMEGDTVVDYSDGVVSGRLAEIVVTVE